MPNPMARQRLTLIPAALLVGALSLLAAAPAAAQRTIPGVPRNVRVDVSATALRLTWQAPSSWGSFPAVGYQIDWAEGASPPAHSSNAWKLVSPDPASDVTKYILTDRTYGTTYHLRIRARSLNPQDNTDGLVSNWVVRSGTPTHSHGPPPGTPTLTATAQTAASLSFSIACVTPGDAPVTNYLLEAEKTDGSVVKHTHTVPLPCATETVTVTGLDNSTTYRVRAYARNLFARNSKWSDWVSATTAQGSGGTQRQSAATVSLSAEPNPVPEGSDVTVTATLSSELSNDVTIPLTLTDETAEAEDHGALASITILAGFLSTSGTITTADDDDADDETFTVGLDVDNFPAEVLSGAIQRPITVTISDDDVTSGQTAGSLLERCAAYLPSNAVSVSEVTGWRDAHSHDAAHVLRWNRVLKALGEDAGAGISPMTVAEAKANEGRFMRSRWARVTKTLEAIQTCLANSGQNWAPTVLGLADLSNETGITYTLSGPLDPNIAEGKSYELKATASSPVQADTTVEIMRDAAASDADEDDYSVEPILIEAGETTGTTMLMVTADDLPDGGTGTNRTETLVLFGSVGGMKIGELMFTIWDAAVPALPVGGALALGLLLMWCGVVRARMRGAVSRRDEDG